MTESTGEDSISTLAQLRADIAITRHFSYFQTASHGPVPDSVQRFIAETLRIENELVLAMGGPMRYVEFHRRAEEARQTLANFLGVTPIEAAWAYNTTTASRLAVRSLDWKRGDKLAVTDVEHAGTRELVRSIGPLVGVNVTVIPTGDGPTFSPMYFLEQLDRLLTPDHRMLIMSHVANVDGRRLPVKEATQIAHQRGVKVLIDGAQAVGVFPVNVADIGCEFYSGSVHKWLLGPAGVGFLVVNRKELPHYNPNFVPVTYEDGDGRMVTDLSAGRLSELGTPNTVLRMAAAYGIEIFQRIGLLQIERHVSELSARLRDGLDRVPGARLAGPYPWHLSSAITSIQLPGYVPDQIKKLVTCLRDEYHIITKYRPEINAIRVGIAAFNTVEEVDRLLDVLARLVPTM